MICVGKEKIEKRKIEKRKKEKKKNKIKEIVRKKKLKYNNLMLLYFQNTSRICHQTMKTFWNLIIHLV
jgi:hypothetical protein